MADFSFFKKAKEILRPPEMSDPEKNRSARFMYFILLAGMLASAVSNYVFQVNGWKEKEILSLVVLLVLTLTFIILNIKKLKLAIYMMLVLLLVVFLLILYRGYGIYDPISAYIPIMIVLAGFLLEGYEYYIYSSVASVSSLAVAIIVYRKIGTTFAEPPEFRSDIIFTGVLYVFIILIIRYFAVNLLQFARKARESEERFRSFTEKVKVGIYTFDDSGHFTYVNDYMCDFFGYSREVLLKMNYLDLVHPDEREVVGERARKRLMGEEVIDQYELRVIRKDGSVAWLFIFASKVDIKGKRIGLGGLVDITKRKRLEEDLKEEKEKLLVTLKSIGDGVIVTDTVGKIILMSHVAEELTGWSAEEAGGKYLDEVLKLREKGSGIEIREIIKKLKLRRETFHLEGEIELVSKNGMRKIISDSFAPIMDTSKKLIGSVIVFRDITEKVMVSRRLEKAKKLESLGLLAGGIAHDFNNLLTGILGNINLLEIYFSENNREKIIESIEETKKATLRATGLTRQLLTFSRGGSPVKEITSLEALIEENVRFVLSGSRIGHEISIGEGLWKVDVDPNQISQVIQNLVINAIQSMPDGGKIRIKAENLSIEESRCIHGVEVERGDYVCIEVSDEGVGIPEEIRGEIFDPYFTTKEMGSGLGLSTVYSIVKQHNGYIAFESEPGSGTTFYIFLHRAEKIEKGKDESESLAAGEGRGNLRGRVLIMDDEESVRTVFRKMLERMSFRVDEVTNGEDAVSMFQKAMVKGNGYDIVFLDLTIPGGMGGEEVAEKIRDIDNDAVIVAMSGYSNSPVMANFGEYGFAGILKKPFVTEELKALLTKVMNR